jgi:hypothetical protein
LALVIPEHTDGFAPSVIVGIGLTVTLIAYVELVQPVVLLATAKLPVYVAAAAAPGTTNTIGVAGNNALATSTKPAVCAAALYVMLYLSGVPVVAV